jgi:CheY-like chemotaxis protein
LTLILHELATNAVKHGALSIPTGRVVVTWSSPGKASSSQLRFAWRESGGPPVKEPATKGFGLTLLQSAARDIGAVPAYEFAEDGFVYALQGPFERTGHSFLPDPTTAPASARKVAVGASKPDAGSRVLVIEDEPLVALQLQMDLESGGYQVVGPGRSLPEGIALAQSEDIDAALVDVRLGHDLSVQIADLLLARKIPFVFATGYSDSAILPEHLREVPRLNKPFSMDQLRQTVERLVGGGKQLSRA